MLDPAHPAPLTLYLLDQNKTRGSNIVDVPLERIDPHGGGGCFGGAGGGRMEGGWGRQGGSTWGEEGRAAAG